MIQNDVLGNAKQEGLAEGRAQGRAEGRAEGRAQGIAEGKAQGEAEAKKSIALNLLAQSIPLEVVSQATGLSIDEIKKLIKQ